MANPLTNRAGSYGPPLSRHDLLEYIDRLNASRLTHRMGVRWVLSSRKVENGEIEYFLDRQESEPVAIWTPSPEEIEATKDVTARHIALGTDTARFMAMVRRGQITREVQELMANRSEAA